MHRISAIRNRKGKIIGLTCRIGRAVLGSIALIRDIVEQGQSVLILVAQVWVKPPCLREIARVLADEANKRVVIVDTSNEIAGDGDIPHPGIGRARRMQVARTAEQHAVMIEAVENHMPQVMRRIQDVHVLATELLPAPHLLKNEMPVDEGIARTVVEARETIREVLAGRDRRMLFIVGPCSIHDPDAAIDYARRLAKLKDATSDRLYLVMRVYFGQTACGGHSG